MQKRLIGLIGLIGLILSGCAPMSVSDEQKKQIVAADPSFEKVLQAKSGYDAQLADLRAKFLIDKNTFELKVAGLRKEFDAKRTQFYGQASEIKSQLDPQRQKIKSELVILTEEYKNQLKNAQAIKGMLTQAKSIAEGKYSSNLPQQEREQWAKRLESLSEEYSSASEETAALKAKLEVSRLKQRSLIQ